MIPFQESNSGVTFAEKVHPRAKKNAVTGEVGDSTENLADLASRGRPGQRGVHRILCETFEGAALFRYHCARPQQPE